MLRSNNGFFLLELLLSLSALLLLSLYLLPLLMELRAESQQLEINKTAQRIMFEELQAKVIDNQAYTDYTIIQNRIVYKIIWIDSGLDSKKEVCVKVEKTPFLPESKMCHILE
ncbi:competence type IV pilus minor pilin ComGE [Neobacillus jeddahensis]|uniref:competence type IV pilus minor pilin ComGE n=1 Tax=Neobacillus jeddahensis TaxID=1461580 RepID=UPI00058C1385|nr:competence type IV pilus minor pilin ComGE [Neobacillus jeddahensis]